MRPKGACRKVFGVVMAFSKRNKSTQRMTKTEHVPRGVEWVAVEKQGISHTWLAAKQR